MIVCAEGVLAHFHEMEFSHMYEKEKRQVSKFVEAIPSFFMSAKFGLVCGSFENNIFTRFCQGGRSSCFNILEFFFYLNGQMSQAGLTPLALAASLGHTASCIKLVESGADIDAVDIVCPPLNS